MLKGQVAARLEEMADLLEVQSENPFQPRAFRNAARTIEGLPEELEDVIADGRLRDIPGIGESIAREITDLAASGASRRLRELRAAVPPGVLDMLKVPGLGPKKARALSKDLGIDSLGALKAACEKGAVAGLKGFGEKTQQKLLDGIAYVSSVAGRFRVDDALPRALLLLEHLKRCPKVRTGRTQHRRPANSRIRSWSCRRISRAMRSGSGSRATGSHSLISPLESWVIRIL